jgi:hypothetical protein
LARRFGRHLLDSVYLQQVWLWLDGACLDRNEGAALSGEEDPIALLAQARSIDRVFDLLDTKSSMPQVAAALWTASSAALPWSTWVGKAGGMHWMWGPLAVSTMSVRAVGSPSSWKRPSPEDGCWVMMFVGRDALP